MVITGIVVAFAASALAVALMLRLAEETGSVTLDPDVSEKPRTTRAEEPMTPAEATTAGGVSA